MTVPPSRLARASLAAPARTGCGCLAVLVVVVVLVVASLLAGRGGDSTSRPAPAATSSAGFDQVETCRRVGVGFVTVYSDRAMKDAEWRRVVGSWVTPAISAQLGTVDRARIPARRVKSARVSAQPGSCDVTVAFTDGGPDLPVVVDNTTGTWKVSSWGS